MVICLSFRNDAALPFDNSRTVAYVLRPPATGLQDNRKREAAMYVWSKRIVIGLLTAFTILMALFLIQDSGNETSTLKLHTIRWILLNYIGLMIWLFVWMFDQARVRGKSLVIWFLPFLFAPLPTLMIFVLVLQRRLKG
jgi:hypothetical protein